MTRRPYRKPDRRAAVTGLEGAPASSMAPEEAASQGGVYQTEYTVVLILVAVVASLAIGALAVPLIRYHLSITEAITAPVP